jgi:LmbE family N-acetylglucosaminyl deacetylase
MESEAFHFGSTLAEAVENLEPVDVVVVVRAEPGKQKPQSCRAQELARSSAQENERRKKVQVLPLSATGSFCEPIPI